jgi:hypothetical protein
MSKHQVRNLKKRITELQGDTMQETIKRTDESGNIWYEKREITLLSKNDYEQCLNAQSGCNATGLINSMKEITECLWNTAKSLNKGTEWVNHHPILQLYAYQLAHLTHGREPIEWVDYGLSYAFCEEVIRGNIDPNADWTHFFTP